MGERPKFAPGRERQCAEDSPLEEAGFETPRSPARYKTLSRLAVSPLRHFPFRRRDRLVREGDWRFQFPPAARETVSPRLSGADWHRGVPPESAEIEACDGRSGEGILASSLSAGK